MAAATLVVAFAAGSPSSAASADDCAAEANELLAAHTTTENGERHVGADEVEACGFSVSVAELEDIMFLAEDEGTGLAVALERYHGQEDFGEAVEELRSEFPDRYAGARFEADGDSWVAFADEAPSAAADHIAALDVEVVEGRGFSKAELNRTMEQIFTDISDRPDVDSSASSYDQVTGEITIQVVMRDGAAADELLAQDWQADNPAITVEVEVLDEPAWEPETNLWGGGHTNTSGCTSNFSVRHSDGRTGVATAHHCATIQNTSDVHSTDRYQHHGNGTEVTIFYRDRASGTHGDIAWYGSTTNNATNTYYYNHNAVRTVTGTSAPSTGQTIYNYGRTSGRGFEQVDTLNHCVNYSGYPQYCGLTVMGSHITAGGDSGGPWYFGNTAYGVHSGTSAGGSVFTPVQGNLFNGMSVLVQTN